MYPLCILRLLADAKVGRMNELIGKVGEDSGSGELSLECKISGLPRLTCGKLNPQQTKSSFEATPKKMGLTFDAVDLLQHTSDNWHRVSDFSQPVGTDWRRKRMKIFLHFAVVFLSFLDTDEVFGIRIKTERKILCIFWKFVLRQAHEKNSMCICEHMSPICDILTVKNFACLRISRLLWKRRCWVVKNFLK